MPYLGNSPQLQGAYDKADDISSQFDGSVTTFAITVNGEARTIGKATNLVVAIDHNIQEPDVDYTISGSNIIFTTAPASGAKCFITILGDVFKAPATGNTDLNSLLDVVIGSPADDQVLTYSAGSWINKAAGTSFISNNTDVDTTAAVADDKLKFDGTQWYPVADTLANINDVDLTTAPTNLQILTWDSKNSRWIPMDPQSTVSVLTDLTDVDAPAPALNEVLTWDGTKWTALPTQETVTSINDLSDVDTVSVSPFDGQALVWSNVSGKWVPGDVQGGGGAEYINDLKDVDTATNPPQIDQTLKWNGSNWVPGTSSGGGATSIDDLTDVDTSTDPPEIDEALIWDGTNWVPKPVSTDAGGLTVESGVIQIYVDALAGDDATGDGTNLYPYRTLEKAFDSIKNRVTASGHIEILCKEDVEHKVTTSIVFEHPNRIVVKSQSETINTKLSMTDTSSSDDNVIFQYRNSVLELVNITTLPGTPAVCRPLYNTSTTMTNCDISSDKVFYTAYSEPIVDKKGKELVINNTTFRSPTCVIEYFDNVNVYDLHTTTTYNSVVFNFCNSSENITVYVDEYDNGLFYMSQCSFKDLTITVNVSHEADGGPASEQHVDIYYSTGRKLDIRFTQENQYPYTYFYKSSIDDVIINYYGYIDVEQTPFPPYLVYARYFTKLNSLYIRSNVINEDSPPQILAVTPKEPEDSKFDERAGAAGATCVYATSFSVIYRLYSVNYNPDGTNLFTFLPTPLAIDTSWALSASYEAMMIKEDIVGYVGNPPDNGSSGSSGGSSGSSSSSSSSSFTESSSAPPEGSTKISDYTEYFKNPQE